MLPYIAQLFGCISLIFLVLSYVSKDKTKYLGKQLIANACYSMQFLCLSAGSAFWTTTIATVKTIVFYAEQKKCGKLNILSLIVFEVLYIISGVFTITSAVASIPVLISVSYTWAAWQPNLKITCIAGVVCGLLWIVYNFFVGAYVAIVSGIIESVAGVVGFIKQCRLSKDTECSK